MSGERKSYAHPRRAAPLVALDDHVPRVPPIERTKSWTLSGLSPEVRTRDKPTVSPSGRSFATSTRATGARLKLCQAQAVGRFPAESYSLPILSFPLQPLRPHNGEPAPLEQLARSPRGLCRRPGSKDDHRHDNG